MNSIYFMCILSLFYYYQNIILYKNLIMTLQALKTQIQYYMSDKNLQQDDFFYNKIVESKEGFIQIELLLNCNKIKKLNVKNIEELVKAIKQSELLELHQNGKLFRRKQNKDLPQKITKKVKTQNNSQNKKQQPKEQDPNPYKNIQTIIFSILTDKEVSVNYRFIQQALNRTFNLHPPYIRFSKVQGNFALNKKQYSEQIRQKIEAEGLKVGEATFKIKKTEGKQLQEFKQKHEFHYNGIIERKKKQFESKLKQQKRNKKRNKVIEFSFGGQKYTDINKLKSLFKNILCRAPNNVPLKETEQKLLIELLSYHQKGTDKTKELKHFVVDIHPQHKDTRCFFVVRNDGSREDFSAVKCISNLQQKYDN